EHRIAEHFVAATGLTIRLRARVRTRRAEIHETARIAHAGDGPQQELVEQRKDGGVRADAERKRQDGNDCHEGRLEQRAESELEIRHRGKERAMCHTEPAAIRVRGSRLAVKRFYSCNRTTPYCEPLTPNSPRPCSSSFHASRHIASWLDTSLFHSVWSVRL